ncbi:YheC/YheD family protein [Paenibacillus pasadenensis]|uniref:ATP-grasp domain-containing protein n=1 Tax=Paenibacillus pasadenensis TaxID=217090 RepID=A0A2N5NDI4_9BACL|nr:MULTISPECIES: YheC/YheD family protein [Paenibacillus]PLT48382.1 hypothetical protein B8V81_0514 [Paenibacillus pasadenensis]QGG58139.1 hypothetical protein GE073_22880 [Paenibacillus sp. B01]
MPSVKKYVKRYKSRALWGKLRVSRMLKKDPATAGLVPAAKPFSLERLTQMASRYEMLYIKPNIGSLGMGVHRLRRTASGDYELASVLSRKQTTRSFRTIDAVYRHLKRRKSGKKLLIQRGIPLDQVEGRPYDLRAMVQRRPKGPWTCTAFTAKIASPSKIVTNVHQGAKLVMLSSLWEMQGLPASAARANTDLIERKALAVSRSLSRRYKGMHEMGIDFAIDRSKKLWVLEVNTNHPQFRPVKKLDRAAYNRMASFARSYGRYDD